MEIQTQAAVRNTLRWKLERDRQWIIGWRAIVLGVNIAIVLLRNVEIIILYIFFCYILRTTVAYLPGESINLDEISLIFKIFPS